MKNHKSVEDAILRLLDRPLGNSEITSYQKKKKKLKFNNLSHTSFKESVINKEGTLDVHVCPLLFMKNGI